MSLADVVKILLTQKKTENPEDFVENVKGVFDGSVDLSSLGSESEAKPEQEKQQYAPNQAWNFVDSTLNDPRVDDKTRTKFEDRLKPLLTKDVSGYEEGKQNASDVYFDLINQPNPEERKSVVVDLLNRADDARRDLSQNDAGSAPKLNPSVSSELSNFNQAREDYIQRQNNERNYGMGVPDNVGLTDDRYLEKYRDFFNGNGGLEQGYRTGDQDVLSGVQGLIANSSLYDRGEMPQYNPLDMVSSGLDRIANENYDDGTMRADSVKSKYMRGDQYKKYVEAGFGGRPIDEIDDNATYNKLDEAKNYGFVPYIEDAGQFANWSLSQLGDDVTKAYNVFGNARDLLTEPTAEYNGQNIGLDEFVANYENAQKKDENKSRLWEVSDGNGGVEERFFDASKPKGEWIDDETYRITFPEAGKYYDFADIEDAKKWASDNLVYRDNALTGLSYKRPDGSSVSMSADDISNFINGLDNGSLKVDYGIGNIAKGQGDRKDFWQMFSTGDFSDLAPNTLDLLLGSVPLFTPITAWPMAAGNAVTASQGLDPQLYDAERNAYSRLSDEMNGDKYVANTVLSGLVPLTEHVAGIVGGGSGVLGKPIQKFLRNRGAPPSSRYAVDMLGEGVEEDVAQLWEDYQKFGHEKWFANPVYETDEEGNILYREDPVTGEMVPRIKPDTTGHEVRDPNTPWTDRLANAWDPMKENFAAGAFLGTGLGLPRAVSNKITGTGYYSDEERINRRSPGYNLIKFSDEDFGTYHSQRG